jgi:hypothetical protein
MIGVLLLSVTASLYAVMFGGAMLAELEGTEAPQRDEHEGFAE